MIVNANWVSIANILAPLIIAFFITDRIIPTVNYVARTKGLLNTINSRTSHRYSTPNLGGLSIFIAITIALLIFVSGTAMGSFKFIYLAMFIILFVGLKDDILILTPEKKLLAQFCAAILVVYSDLRITNLHEFFGLGELDHITSTIITIFLIIVIMNSINLIDGIDGLAATIGVITMTTFGFWFWLDNEIDWAVICAGFIGALIAFFRYNVFGLRNKTFMGDCGSLVLGLILACIVIKFNEMNIGVKYPYVVKSAPAVSFGIMIIPLFDTLRVFVIRILKRTSPFTPDRNHLHHRVIDLGFSHFQASMILGGLNILFIVVSFLLRDIGIIRLGVLLIILATLISLLPNYIMKKRNRAIEG